MNYLVDTNVISELVKLIPNETVLKWIDGISDEKLYLSVITIGELRKGISGIQDPQWQKKISQWLEVELPDYFEDRILDIDIKVVNMWGQLQGKNKGYTLPAVDGFIAATAKVYDLTLLTRNEKDFIHASIEIINPWKNNPNW